MSAPTTAAEAADARRRRLEAGRGRTVGRRDRKRRDRGARAWIELQLFRALHGWLLRAPLGAGYRLFEVLLLLAFAFLPRLRQRSLASLAIAYGDRPLAWRRRIMRASARELAWTLCDWVRTPAVLGPPDLRVRVDVEDAVAALVRAGVGGDGPGVLIISCHLSEGDLIATRISQRLVELGLPGLLAAVRPVDNLLVNKVLVADRERFGRGSADKHGFLRRAIKHIKRGGAACMHVDQDAGRTAGVFVPFFGTLASTTPGAAQIARLARATVIGLFAVRTVDARKGLGYRCHVVGPLELASTGDRDRDLLEWTREMTAAVEQVVRRWPEQYAWVHRRWKSRPAAPTGPRSDGDRGR